MAAIKKKHLKTGQTSEIKNAPRNSCFYRIQNIYKGNAKRKKLKWGLSENQFFNLITAHCSYCGSPPYRIATGAHTKFTFNGLDRISSEVGYTPENVQTCCTKCNSMKSDKPTDVFLFQVMLIAKHIFNLK